MAADLISSVLSHPPTATVKQREKDRQRTYGSSSQQTMPPVQLPAAIIDELVAKAQGDREVVHPDDLPSPRGVADLNFSFDSSSSDDAAAKKHTVQLFPDEHIRDWFVNRLGCHFVREMLWNTLTFTQLCCRMNACPSDVTEALALMVGGSNCDEKNWVAGKMDTDDSSDYGSVDNTEGEDDDLDEHVEELSDYDGDEVWVVEKSYTGGCPAFDEAYPPVDGIVVTNREFQDQVIVPIFDEIFRMSTSVLLLNQGEVIVGLIKKAMYAYIVAKLSPQYKILDQLQETSTLLELALWKANIDKSATSGEESLNGRKQCRNARGTDVVVRNVLPYLFTDVSARDRMFHTAEAHGD